MTHFVNYVYNGAPFSESVETTVDVQDGDEKGSYAEERWHTAAPPSSMRRVTVDETSSLASSATASSSSTNDIFPEDFDHRRYTSQSSRATIPLERTNSHTQPVFSPRSRATSDGYSYHHMTNGYKDKDRSKDTLRTVSFDSGFDTSNQRLSSLSSDDSTRWREIKPDKPKQKKHTNMGKPIEKKFLRKVQRELEDQRTQWDSELDHLTGSLGRMPTPSSAGANAQMQGESSYVDTSGPRPIFKAFVDMKGYPARNITVNVDHLTNKVIVNAMESPGPNGVTRTFTQKISLPRYADQQALTSRLSKTGTLKVEVPLLFYFPQPDEAKERDRKAKSFVYQVEKPSAEGPRVLEILVNTGAEYRAKELKVLVEDDSKLVILGEKHATDSRGKASVQRKLIKQYTLPGLADVDRITSKLGKDGRLQVNVPLHD